MIIMENHIGKISISDTYLSSLIGKTVTSCFGVADMNPRNAGEEFFNMLFKKQSYNIKIDRGVNVRVKNGKLIIDLHITVSYGVNISAIKDSIVNKVQFAVQEATGMTVTKINIFIDNMNI